MRSFLQRLFGSEPRQQTGRLSAELKNLEITEFGHGLVAIDALDFIGHSAMSPNGRFRLIWSDRDPEGRRGGHRDEGHGSWALLSGANILAKGRLERPNDGQVADNGTVILSDWMFGSGLNGTFYAFAPDGSELIRQELAANLTSSAISREGSFAVCQTANAPGCPDSCQYILFDLKQGKEISRWEQETGWSDAYEFDIENRALYLLCKDEERIGYSFNGEMMDRTGWERRRILAGDLLVIKSVLAAVDDNPDPELLNLIHSGLETARREGEIWQKARALRLMGELHEHAGRIDKAIIAYDEALTIDPQVGVSRRLEKLRKALTPTKAKSSGKKLNRFERQAQRLGIGHEIIDLELGESKCWRARPSHAWSSVEQAALKYYEQHGWKGAASEGGLILTLIKAASFARLDPRHADTFIEALYAQNVAFDEDRFEPEHLLESVEKATTDQIERNWEVIAKTAQISPAFYPAVRKDHVLELFEQLGSKRLADIAQVFATAPYDLRAGWPDLTLWRDGVVRFVEVKAPGDSMHAKQARLISTIPVPLGFDVCLAQVQSC